jgi:hypothetical protein
MCPQVGVRSDSEPWPRRNKAVPQNISVITKPLFMIKKH